VKKAGKCVHYNGSINECCKAGVNYKTLAGPEPAYARRLPCDTRYADNPVVCEKRQEPTAEEVAADEAWVQKRFEGIGKARAAIVAHLGGPWKRGTPGAGGVIDCPVCSGKQTLRFSRAGYNGHIHAACNTAACVRWME
jgi:hypothetical protein